jgi:hypothetical protein
MRVNSTNVLDEGLRIGGIGRRINSKVKISQARRVSRINVVINLAYSQSVPNRHLLAPICRWPGLKEPVGFDTYYNVSVCPASAQKEAANGKKQAQEKPGEQQRMGQIILG